MHMQECNIDDVRAGVAASNLPGGCVVARVVAVDRGLYRVWDGSREAPAVLPGKFVYLAESAPDLPCVGDVVVARFYDGGSAALILEVLPRKTFLRRKAPGRTSDVQMLAANIDTAFLVSSCLGDFNPRRLERYLAMVSDGRVEPVVVLTKTDAVVPDEVARLRARVASLTAAGIMEVSAVTGAGFAAFARSLVPGRIYCLLGSSGVGKTTLLNRLLGREAFATRAVSASGEGTHTTTRRQLVVLENGALLVDTPGMRELGLVGADSGVDVEYADIFALSVQCRYADCRHENEPGCAVRAAMAAGDLEEERYRQYLKLRKEAEFNDMSNLDRRNKERAFGRFLKTAKKKWKK